MRKITLSIVFSLLFGFVYGQDNNAVLNESRIDETVVTFNLESYDFKTVTTPRGEAKIITADNLSAIMDKAAPDLPKFTESLLIPDMAKMEFEIIASEYIDYNDIEIAPSKGNFARNILPASVPYEYGRNYDQDQFYPNKLASLDAAYIMRDLRGQALHVYPFQYNPVRKRLRVYSEITVRVYTNEDGGANQIETSTEDAIDSEFANVYKRHFINYEEGMRYTPVEEEGNMLIICYDDWTSYMDEFVLWKNTIGRPTEMVTVTEAGGTAAGIEAFVENYYNTNGLTYLLLVGDSEQVPTMSGGTLGGHSDNAYAYISGDDHYQEFFVGRFSAEDPLHVMTQVERAIEYENGNTLTDGWLNKAMSIASNDGGGGDDGEMDWEHLRNIQTDLEGFTYEAPFYEFFAGSQGTPDAAGNPTASDVATALNAGLGFANYTGHGSDIEWVTSGFNISDVNSLVNDNKLPFIYDVACVNGNFVGQECFAEAWVRAKHDEEPTGAIAIAAATINQSWNPPMIAQDEMTDILVGTSTTAPNKRTYAGILVNGMFQMGDESSDWAMLDTWTCFGDPSLYVRTDNTSDMVVTHNDVIIVGETTFAVSCDLDGALATISNNGTIIGSAYVSGGSAAIPVADLTPGTELTLAVVGFNKVTYLTTLNVIAPDGSYLVVDSYENTIDFGQTNDLDITIKNVGVDASTGVSVTVATTDPNASVVNPTYGYGDIAADATSAVSTGVFSLTVANDVVDQYIVPVNITITDATETWNETKNVTVNAPALSVESALVIDDSTGDADGILDQGETIDITIQSSNLGHADITNVIGNITTESTAVVLNTDTTSPIGLTVSETGDFVFAITANDDAADGTVVTINYTVSGGVSGQYIVEESFDIIIGFVPEYCTPTHGNTEDEFIERMQFVTIDNTSAQGPEYTDFTEISTEITQGNSYEIIITNGNHFGGDAMGCWVDWNYDGDFDDDNESYAIAYSSDIGTGTITVPTDASLGARRLRVRVVYNDTPMPCGDSNYGEAEDYTVVVLEAAAITCEAPDSLYADSITVSSAELGWTESGTAITWDVEFGLEGFTTTGTPTFSTESNPHAVTDLETNTCYDFYVRANCGVDGTSDWVGPYNFCTLNDIGVNEGEIDAIIKMYPNPTDGILKIDTQQNVSILLFDLLGKQLMNTSLTTGLNTIDIASFDTGVYFVRIALENNAEQANKTYRIIKK